MSNSALPEAAESYLRALAAELADAPPDTVREIIEGVRAHIAEALDSGRQLDQALAGLGSPQAVAAQAREELVPADRAGDRVAGVGRALRMVAVVLGVLTAVCVSFLLPSTALPSDLAGPEGQSIMRRLGPGFAMLTLLPALIAAVPFVVPPRVREVTGVVGAGVLTALACATGEVGLYYLPLVLMLWAATVVPWVLRRRIGRPGVRSWRLVAAGAVILPGLLLAFSVATGSLGIEWLGVVLWIVGPLVVGALCAFGLRIGYALTALAGALVMAFAITERGFLFAAFWVFGGLYLMIGATGVVTTRPEQRPAGPIQYGYHDADRGHASGGHRRPTGS
ncbi:hypothetical protein [Micromonospora sp. NPDC047134]|uniref:HAAS signaling domain-containing protein n=1 Tax=Micromonospora sp. NPDC047134 TaxID=3154340 RepID=UPI0033FB723A